jgi:hypothetical protein
VPRDSRLRPLGVKIDVATANIEVRKWLRDTANVRLIALHHLDVPWYPMLIGQREGRMVRQGNQNKVVQIYAYATLTSMDAPMWGANERKQRFIDAALSGDRSVRVIEMRCVRPINEKGASPTTVVTAASANRKC